MGMKLEFIFFSNFYIGNIDELIQKKIPLLFFCKKNRFHIEEFRFYMDPLQKYTAFTAKKKKWEKKKKKKIKKKLIKKE